MLIHAIAVLLVLGAAIAAASGSPGRAQTTHLHPGPGLEWGVLVGLISLTVATAGLIVVEVRSRRSHLAVIELACMWGTSATAGIGPLLG